MPAKKWTTTDASQFRKARHRARGRAVTALAGKHRTEFLGFLEIEYAREGLPPVDHVAVKAQLIR